MHFNSVPFFLFFFLSFVSNNSAFWSRKVKLFVLCVVKAMDVTLIVSRIIVVTDRQKRDLTLMLQCWSVLFPLLCSGESENPHQLWQSLVICIAIDQCLLLSKG